MDFVERLANYVEGKGKRPFEENEIDDKPVIVARLNGKRGSILLDTGASCNLIDKQFLDTVLREDKDVQLDRTVKPKIICASKTEMKVYGEVKLNLGLAACETKIRFFVVENLCDSAIIGVKSLKRLGIKICLNNDCCYFNNVLIPFEKKIAHDTSIMKSVDSKNVMMPTL